MYVAVFKCNKSSASLLSKLLFLFPSWLVLEKFDVWFDTKMRGGNLPDRGHDKVTWIRSRDLLTRRRDNVTPRCGGQRTTATLLDVSFGTYRRRCRDVLMGRCGLLPLRRLGDLPLRFIWVFHLELVWDVVETYWWDVVVTSSWDVVMTFQ